MILKASAKLHLTKPELRFCAGSNPARCVSEICDGEDLWQWSRLEIRLTVFCLSTIPQKQFTIISKWMYFLIKDDDLLKKYNTIWDKVSI